MPAAARHPTDRQPAALSPPAPLPQPLLLPPHPACRRPPAALSFLRLASSFAFLFCSVLMRMLVVSFSTTCCGVVSWSAM